MKVFLFKTKNFQADLFDPWMRPKELLTLQVRMNLGEMGGKIGYVWFYDVSTIEGYLIPDLLDTYILNI